MFSKVWVEMFQLGDVTLFPFIKRNLVSSTDYKLFLKNDCVNKQYFHPPPPPPTPGFKPQSIYGFIIVAKQSNLVQAIS